MKTWRGALVSQGNAVAQFLMAALVTVVVLLAVMALLNWSLT
jgi:hypothetical protein